MGVGSGREEGTEFSVRGEEHDLIADARKVVGEEALAVSLVETGEGRIYEQRKVEAAELPHRLEEREDVELPFTCREVLEAHDALILTAQLGVKGRRVDADAREQVLLTADAVKRPCEQLLELRESLAD